MMVPSDIQRVPLMKLQINAVEAELKTARAKSSIKLAIYYRGDALGEGTRDGLVSLMINGTTLANAITAGKAREDAYDPLVTDNAALVTAYTQFQPDIIVVVGAAEAVKYFIVPLEAAWPRDRRAAAVLHRDRLDQGARAASPRSTGNDDLRAAVPRHRHHHDRRRPSRCSAHSRSPTASAGRTPAAIRSRRPSRGWARRTTRSTRSRWRWSAGPTSAGPAWCPA